MEPLTIFASAVGFIGGLHLLSQVIERFGKGNKNRAIRSGKRDDWYCFFALSDLFGAKNTINQQITLTEAERMELIRKHQANRPRLHA